MLLQSPFFLAVGYFSENPGKQKSSVLWSLVSAKKSLFLSSGGLPSNNVVASEHSMAAIYTAAKGKVPAAASIPFLGALPDGP